jgi:uncharacterized ion transporter superfamily protein YfcC
MQVLAEEELSLSRSLALSLSIYMYVCMYLYVCMYVCMHACRVKNYQCIYTYMRRRLSMKLSGRSE